MKAEATAPLATSTRVHEAVAAAEDRKAIDLRVLHLSAISDFTKSKSSRDSIPSCPRWSSWTLVITPTSDQS